MQNFRKIEDQKEWQSLLDKASFKTFFHSLEWESFLEEQFSWLNFERYLWQNKALISLGRFKKGNSDMSVSHPFCEYGGPLLLPGAEGIDFLQLKNALSQYLTSDVRYWKISIHPNLNPLMLDIRGLSTEGRETYFLPLTGKSQEQLWRTIDRNRRRAIRRAQSENIKVADCQNEQELKKVYRFYLKEMKRHQNIAYPYSFFKFILNSKDGKVLIAKDKEKIIGGNLFLLYNNIVHSYLCGFNQSSKNRGVHSLVLWKAIIWAKENNHQIFDLGAGKKGSALSSFKARWGAKRMPIFEIKNFQTENKLKTSPVRKVWGWLPTWLIKVLSPYLLKRRF